MGRCGQDCAAAAPAKARVARASRLRRSRFVMIPPSICGCTGYSGSPMALDVVRVERMAGRHVEAVVLGAAEGEIGAALRQPDEGDGLALRVEHHHAVQL